MFRIQGWFFMSTETNRSGRPFPLIAIAVLFAVAVLFAYFDEHGYDSLKKYRKYDIFNWNFAPKANAF